MLTSRYALGVDGGGEIGAAYACAGEDWGMILLSGTGAFVHLRTPDGRSVHTGGLGPVLGDYGSGHDSGLKGLRAAFVGTWLDSRATSLREAIPAALGVATLKQVFDLVYEDRVMDRTLACPPSLTCRILSGRPKPSLARKSRSQPPGRPVNG